MKFYKFLILSLVLIGCSQQKNPDSATSKLEVDRGVEVISSSNEMTTKASGYQGMLVFRAVLKWCLSDPVGFQKVLNEEISWTLSPLDTSATPHLKPLSGRTKTDQSGCFESPISILHQHGDQMKWLPFEMLIQGLKSPYQGVSERLKVAFNPTGKEVFWDYRNGNPPDLEKRTEPARILLPAVESQFVGIQLKEITPSGDLLVARNYEFTFDPQVLEYSQGHASTIQAIRRTLEDGKYDLKAMFLFPRAGLEESSESGVTQELLFHAPFVKSKPTQWFDACGLNSAFGAFCVFETSIEVRAGQIVYQAGITLPFHQLELLAHRGQAWFALERGQSDTAYVPAQTRAWIGLTGQGASQSQRIPLAVDTGFYSVWKMFQSLKRAETNTQNVTLKLQTSTVEIPEPDLNILRAKRGRVSKEILQGFCGRFFEVKTSSWWSPVDTDYENCLDSPESQLEFSHRDYLISFQRWLKPYKVRYSDFDLRASFFVEQSEGTRESSGSREFIRSQVGFMFYGNGADVGVEGFHVMETEWRFSARDRISLSEGNRFTAATVEVNYEAEVQTCWEVSAKQNLRAPIERVCMSKPIQDQIHETWTVLSADLPQTSHAILDPLAPQMSRWVVPVRGAQAWVKLKAALQQDAAFTLIPNGTRPKVSIDGSSSSPLREHVAKDAPFLPKPSEIQRDFN